jgi:hypothetical protein
VKHGSRAANQRFFNFPEFLPAWVEKTQRTRVKRFCLSSSLMNMKNVARFFSEKCHYECRLSIFFLAVLDIIFEV